MNASKVELKADKELITDPKTVTLYQKITGKVQYSSEHRSEVGYPLKICTWEMTPPTEGSMMRAKRIVRFFAGKPYVEHWYECKVKPEHIDCYVNSDWAKCKTTRKLVSSVTVFIGDCRIKAVTKTQSVIAQSSGETEFMAIATGMSESRYTQQLLREWGLTRKVWMWSDSSAGRSMAMRLGPGAVKHLETKSMFCQDHFRKKHAVLKKVDGKGNPTDLGTKKLTIEEFQMQCSLNKIFFGDGEVSIDLLAHERLDAGNSRNEDIDVIF